jgi:hypothetical protein
MAGFDIGGVETFGLYYQRIGNGFSSTIFTELLMKLYQLSSS